MALSIQQHTTAQVTTARGVVAQNVTFAGNTTAGNLAVIIVPYTGGTVEATTRTATPLSGSETWTEGAHSYLASVAYGVTIFYCLNSSGTNNGVALNISMASGTDFSFGDACCLFEVAGGSSWALDGSSAASGDTPNSGSGSFTTTHDGDLIVTGFSQVLLASFGYPATAGSTPSNNALIDTNSWSGENLAGYSQWGTQTTHGAINPNFTFTGSSHSDYSITGIGFSWSVPTVTAGPTLMMCGLGF